MQGTVIASILVEVVQLVQMIVLLQVYIVLFYVRSNSALRKTNIDNCQILKWVKLLSLYSNALLQT